MPPQGQDCGDKAASEVEWRKLVTPRTWARAAVQDEKALGPWALRPDPPLVKGGESGHGSASQAPGQEGHLEATEASGPQGVLLEHSADEEASPGDAVKGQMETRGVENGSWACVLPRRPCEGRVPAHTP